MSKLYEKLTAKEKEEFEREMNYALAHHHYSNEGEAHYRNAERGLASAALPIPKHPKLHYDHPEVFKSIWDDYHANHSTRPYTQANHDKDRDLFKSMMSKYGTSAAIHMHNHAEEGLRPKRNNLQEVRMDRYRVSRIVGSKPTDTAHTPATDRIGFYRPLADVVIDTVAAAVGVQRRKKSNFHPDKPSFLRPSQEAPTKVSAKMPKPQGSNP